MKKVIQVLMLIVVAGLSYWLYTIIITPVKFDETKKTRDAAVIERLKSIRNAQHAFKNVYGHYTSTFDSLINFIENDSIKFEIKFGSEDDSLAVAQGKVKTEIVKMAVKDTIFAKGFDAKKLRYIPYTDNIEFIMDAKTLVTESKITIPVFEVKAPFKTYLGDLDQQILINKIDGAKTVERYPGLKLGSITQATNDAGNWE
ncbi:MAG: hypothetical protein RR277_00315 [Rikenellaceae bacterium]